MYGSEEGPDWSDLVGSTHQAHSFLQDYLKAHNNAYPNAPQGLRIISRNIKNEEA